MRKTRLQTKAWVLLLRRRAVVPPPLPSPGRAATPPQPPRRRGSLNEYTGFMFHTFFLNRLFSLTRLDEKNILSKRRLVGFSDFLITTSTLWVGSRHEAGDNCVLCRVLYWISIDPGLFSEKVIPTPQRNSLQVGLRKIIELMTEAKLPREV